MTRVVELNVLLCVDRDDVLGARVTVGMGSDVEVTRIREDDPHHAQSSDPTYSFELEIGDLVLDAIDTLRGQRGEDVRGDLAPTPSQSPDACNLPLRAPHIEPEETCQQCGQQAQAHRHWHGEEVRRG